MQKRRKRSKLYFAVRWKRTKDDEGTPLEDLVKPDDFPKGGAWSYSPFFARVETALTYGFKPSEFGLCDPEDDLSVMVAHNDTKARMSAYLEKKRPKPKG